MVLCIITSHGYEGGYIVCEDLPSPLPEAITFKFRKVAPNKYKVIVEAPYREIMEKLYREARIYEHEYPGVIEHKINLKAILGETIYARDIRDLRRKVQNMVETLLRRAGYI